MQPLEKNAKTIFLQQSKNFPCYINKQFKIKIMGYLFTSESVSEGHPDKLADQISDALLDEFLRWDPNRKLPAKLW